MVTIIKKEIARRIKLVHFIGVMFFSGGVKGIPFSCTAGYCVCTGGVSVFYFLFFSCDLGHFGQFQDVLIL